MSEGAIKSAERRVEHKRYRGNLQLELQVGT